MDKDKIEQGVRLILEGIGENLSREGLKETPARVSRMCEEIFCGINKDPSKVIQIMFSENHNEMVLVKDIPLYSICEHHLMPFIGRAHVAYIPGVKGKITGISKLARVVDVVAKRPQVQERLTTVVADTLVRMLNPLGVFVVVEAEHLCMSMRGVQKPGALTITSAVRGIFLTNDASRQEALSLIHARRD
ncbi:GTP cyclohydrolase I FolE [Candidatus Oleimmundimicrobium sp.]|uniref:GTP cyclohydrolase I FolE n=1 Tax=Candidatus Oleimmundimicrobium sp. TaxID=3060597 RepID=UPI00271E2E2E|nr:GTP cyclohydrolase I FolE [Candidatus Oleimmundimicrobium sp.]MDO8885916.1 GTP cyclohydrolase I FolE [Candidatus Oleimmundimicrobium sp.]